MMKAKSSLKHSIALYTDMCRLTWIAPCLHLPTNRLNWSDPERNQFLGIGIRRKQTDLQRTCFKWFDPKKLNFFELGSEVKLDLFKSLIIHLHIHQRVEQGSNFFS